ncbi:MAG TPA: MarR family winged helix-turn-helix transcriptional regulator [Bacillota bacterium]
MANGEHIHQENSNRPLFCLLIKNTWQKLSRYYNQRLAGFDLTVPKALLLLEISPGGGESPKSLGTKLDLESSSMTGLLNRLEKKGLIERRRDPRDRRGLLIFLTPNGIIARETIKSLVNEMDHKLQGALSPDEIKVFRKVSTVIGKQLLSS